MKALSQFIATLVLIAGAAYVGFWYGQNAAPAVHDAGDASATQPADADAPGADKPVVPVRTTVIRQGTLQQTLIAYGPVAAEPSAVTTMSVPFESRMGRILVTAGQPVAAGAPLGEVTPSPETQLELAQAKSALTAAQQSLTQIQQQFADHLATNADLLQARQNLDAAQLKFDSMTASGAAGTQPINASAAGIISKIDVQEGQIVPAGSSLIEIASGDAIQARLGVEPSAAADVHVGDRVDLVEVRSSSPAAVAGKVERIGGQLNADTGLVDVVVSLPSGNGIMLGAFVRGELRLAPVTGLIVPRKAALPEEDGCTLMTVKDGHAVKHQVSVLAQNDQNVLIGASDVAVGDTVIVVGNYDLDDGTSVSATAMNVDSDAPATQPATGLSTRSAAAEEARP